MGVAMNRQALSGVIGHGDSFPVSPIPAANVASVPQRSPLRYPGGKTWLIPHVRAWLSQIDPKPRLLIEPFCGGGIVSLTAVMEDLAERCLMAELDRDVAAFWQAALRHGSELCARVLDFDPTREAVRELACEQPDRVLERGFRTLVLNRTRRGGILAPGASLSRAGENGKGVASRWYPQTITDRLHQISAHADRLDFHEMDGLRLLASAAGSEGSVVFADPPYTAGGKRAGQRLYAHHTIDHARLFELLADTRAEFMLTYDRAPEIVSLILRHCFHAVEVTMKNTHHTRLPELVITPKPIAFASARWPDLQPGGPTFRSG